MSSMELSREDMAVKSPFVHQIHRSTLRRLQMYLFTVFVLPFRLFFMVIFFLLSLLVGELATRKMDFSRPMSGFRQRVLLPLFIFFSRALFFSGGFIWVEHKGRRATFAEAPIIVLAPHSSFFDSLVVVSLGMPSVVGKTETALSPIGSYIKMTQPILVNRDDPMSRQNTLQEIRDRATSGGNWPQVLIFPEGTCTNRSCLINYKQGAFTVGCPVQPALIRWGYGIDSITWTWDGPGVLELLLFTALQPYTTLQIEFLPVYTPSEEEKADPQLYATNVRAVMAKAINLSTTDLSFDDCRRIRTAAQFGLPMSCHILEYGKLTQALFSRVSQANAGDKTSSPPSQAADATKRLLSMASAVRDWHSSTPPITDKLLESTFFTGAMEANNIDPTKLALLKTMLSTLPETKNGQPDIRALVVQLCLLIFPDSPAFALRLAFQAFDGALTPVPPNEVGDREVDHEVDYEEKAGWSISLADVKSLLTFGYRFGSSDISTVLKKCDSEYVRPGTIYQVLKETHASVINSYADYATEMRRMRRRADRPFSETASASASVSSIYSLDCDSSQNFTVKRHQREPSNASMGSISATKEEEQDVRQRNTASVVKTSK